jgi:hypothetical protein
MKEEISNRHETSGDTLLTSRLRRLGEMEPAGDFADRVMGRIAANAPAPVRPARRAMSWLLTPRTFRMSPLGGLAAAACMFLVLGLALRGGMPGDTAVPDGLSPVKFVLTAPGASEVAVIGSFNDWNAAGWSMTRDDATGLWTLATALPPGSHEYVFLIDGTTPVPDASAALSAADGFGSRNSVLVVKKGHESLL